MQISSLLVLLLGLATFAFWLGRGRALALSGGSSRALNSLPRHYGMYAAMWCAVPALLVLLVWISMQGPVVDHIIQADMPPAYQAMGKAELSLVINEVKNVAAGNPAVGQSDAAIQQAAQHLRNLQAINLAAQLVAVLCVAILGALWALRKIRLEQRARQAVEKMMRAFLFVCSGIAVLTTVGIVLSVLFESIRFFQVVPVTDFLFGMNWSPQTAIRSDQVGSSGSFGAVPLFAGTFLISAIAMSIAVPFGLMSAIYIAEYASARVRSVLKPGLEVLAGIPTVVYGFFAALVVAPAIRGFGEQFGLSVASESALAAGIIMGVMIIPFISSLSDDVIKAVPNSLRDGSLAMGATRSETIRHVIIPAALPGIVGGILLAASRAIGETMIVVMAAGLSANLTANPFEAVTTVTVQIVTLLVGDQEFDSPKTLVAFALGLVLFVITLLLNIVALVVVRKYREQYD